MCAIPHSNLSHVIDAYNAYKKAKLMQRQTQKNNIKQLLNNPYCMWDSIKCVNRRGDILNKFRGETDSLMEIPSGFKPWHATQFQIRSEGADPDDFSDKFGYDLAWQMNGVPSQQVFYLPGIDSHPHSTGMNITWDQDGNISRFSLRDDSGNDILHTILLSDCRACGWTEKEGVFLELSYRLPFNEIVIRPWLLDQARWATDQEFNIWKLKNYKILIKGLKYTKRKLLQYISLNESHINDSVIAEKAIDILENWLAFNRYT